MRSRGPRVGRVVLVGAGPGDPDLMTLRGAAALSRADVVLYDSLSTRELRRLAPSNAEWIDVGKRGHEAPVRLQDEINTLLVARALAGQNVVRLKGGDPFVFGRGGEEATACAAAGVPFEVVPGVSSAIAVPAYAGIPVTDRRHAASFAVVSGHVEPGGGRGDTRLGALGQAVDTLVILMGMSNLPQVVAQLLTGGKHPKTPAAAIMHGTLGRQRVVSSALEDLPREATRAGLAAPSVVVVGEVVALRETLSWWEKEPLFGMRALVTRAEDQAHDLASALRTAGAEPVLLPMIALVPPSDPLALATLADVVARISEFDGIVFASSNGVKYLTEAAHARGVDFSRVRARVFCVGQRTAQAALDVGLPVHLVATGRSDAEGLLAQILESASPAGRRFLLPRADIGRTVIADGLRAAGAEVESVETYRNVRPDVDVATLRAELRDGSLPILTFTSPSTVEHFAELLDAPSRRAVEGCIVAAVGRTTAAALRARGIEPAVVPDLPEVGALVAALAEHVVALRGREPSERESEETARRMAKTDEKGER